VAGGKWKWCELACEGDVAMFNQLPADELLAALKTADEDGRSPLHVAVARGHTPLVQLLLASPAAAVAEALQRSDDEARSQTATCGTHDIRVNARTRLLSRSIGESVDLGFGDPPPHACLLTTRALCAQGWGPLHSAASIGNLECVQALLSAGADVTKKNEGGRTPLHYAASKGHAHLIPVLLQKGASINAKDSTGSTALHRAAGTAKLAAVKALLGSGKADLTAEDKEGSTAVLVAVTCGSDAVAVALAAAGADLNAADKEGNSPLRCGASSRLAPYQTSASASIESPKNARLPQWRPYRPAASQTDGKCAGPVVARSVASPDLQRAMKAAAAGEDPMDSA